MSARHDYYQILGIEPEASPDAIRIAYRTIVQRLSSDPGRAREYASLSLINEAFRTLGDPSDRADYDRQRRPRPEPAAPAAAVPTPAAAPDAHAHTLTRCAFCETPAGLQQCDGPEAECTVCGAPLFSAEHHERQPESRRAIDRLPLHMRVSFRRALSPGRAVKGVSQDISLGGMRLLSVAALQIGERVVVECEFCSAVGIVRNVRVHDAAENTWECGLQFVTLHVKHQRGGLLSTVA